MIEEKSLLEIGKVLKPHGVKGELTVLFHKPEFTDLNTEYYFFSIDGMYVPFFVEDFWYKTDVTARIKFQGVDSVEKSLTFNNISIFIFKESVKDIIEESQSNIAFDELVGYTVFNEDMLEIGEISHVDASTINTLFILIKDNREVLIPANNDFITKIDIEQKHLYLNLPQGLLENFDQ